MSLQQHLLGHAEKEVATNSSLDSQQPPLRPRIYVYTLPPGQPEQSCMVAQTYRMVMGDWGYHTGAAVVVMSRSGFF